jgi:hypothetical protein
LACFTTILGAEADLQHLWFARRAATRMRSELMAAVFDKSLKRKDYSAIVDKEKEAAAKDARQKKVLASASTSPSASAVVLKTSSASKPTSESFSYCVG